MWRGPRIPKQPDVWETGERVLMKNGLDRERARKIIDVARRGLDLPVATDMMRDARGKCKRRF